MLNYISKRLEQNINTKRIEFKSVRNLNRDNESFIHDRMPYRYTDENRAYDYIVSHEDQFLEVRKITLSNVFEDETNVVYITGVKDYKEQ